MTTAHQSDASAALLDAYQKARTINRDDRWYGTLAEIGAGQETARWFFHVGGAAGTVAKSMSAYDMVFSDAIYGKSQRYTSRQRLAQMLDHEFGLLQERLGRQHDDKQFFAFANTVAARSHNWHDDGHGWLGVRFQHEVGAEPSEIQIHVRLLDADNVQQQQTLGLVGLNLIYGAYAMADRPCPLIGSLMDGLSARRIEVDMFDFTGPAAQAANVDNRMMSLELVKQGLTAAAMFTRDGQSIELAEALYHKPLLLLRGSFRPVTRTVMAMLEQATRQFADQLDDASGGPVIVTEMNLRDLGEHEEADTQDLLARMEMLQQLGQDVLISNHREHFRVMELLRRYTTAPTAVVMGAPTLKMILDPQSYTDLDGGVFEAMGRLFTRDVHAYVYPYQDGTRVTVDSIRPQPPLDDLYRYMRQANMIVPIEPEHDEQLGVLPRDVLKMIREGDATWESLVPESVAETIKRHNLFGYTSQS